MAPLRAFLIVLTGGLLASACGSTPPASGPEQFAAIRADPAETYRAQLAADARRIAGQTSGLQAGVLRDGRVTYTEYAQSTRALARCLRNSPLPLRVSAIKQTPGRELNFDMSLRAATRKTHVRLNERAQRTFKACRLRYSSDVALIYSNQRVIPPSERLPVRDRLVACLRAAGVVVRPSRATTTQIVTALNADHAGKGRRCADRYFDFFRAPAPVQ